MTAGRGIIHSEMPQQESGLMQGFQLWLNLPAAEKMKEAAYVDISPERIPVVQLAEGISAKVIAGTLQQSSQQWAGPIQGLSTEPLYFDLSLDAGKSIRIPVAAGHNALLYPFVGEISVAGSKVKVHHAAVLEQNGDIELTALTDCRLLLLAAKPIGEPVVQYGPFVMNSVAEIEQAIHDYQSGRLTSGKAAQSIPLHQ